MKDKKIKWYEWLIAILIFVICLAAGFGLLWYITKKLCEALLYFIVLAS